MFERFTERARRVIVLAQEEARMLNHNYIGTEHILLGLFHEGEGAAAKALESTGVTLDAAREKVEEIIGHGSESPSGHIPFTPRAKKVLELAYRDSTHLNQNWIGTEHILRALIGEGDGIGMQVLCKLTVVDGGKLLLAKLEELLPSDHVGEEDVKVKTTILLDLTDEDQVAWSKLTQLAKEGKISEYKKYARMLERLARIYREADKEETQAQSA